MSIFSFVWAKRNMQIKCSTHHLKSSGEWVDEHKVCVKCESVGGDSPSASVLTKDVLAANGSVFSRWGLTAIGVCVSCLLLLSDLWSPSDGVCVLADGVFVRTYGISSKWVCWLDVECISENPTSFSKAPPTSSLEVMTLGEVNVSSVSVGGACDSGCLCVFSGRVMSVCVSLVCGVCSPLHAPCSWHRQRKRETSESEFFVGIYSFFQTLKKHDSDHTGRRIRGRNPENKHRCV